MRIIADTDMWIPDAFDVETSSMPAYDYIASGMTLLQVSKARIDKNIRYRVSCNDMVNNLLHYEEENGIITQKPKLLIYERCKHFLETFPALIISDNNPEDIADKQEDHPYDAFKYVCMYLQQPVKKDDVDLNLVPYPHIYEQQHGQAPLHDKDLKF